jgi:hypothetical protein
MKLILISATTLLAAHNTIGAEYIAYDNTSGYQGTVTSRPNIEVGDEINLIGGPATMTRFQFEYNATGMIGGEFGVVRIYDMRESSIPRDYPFLPGNLLFESQPFTLLDGFHQGSIDNLSLAVPDRIVWSVEFSGITAPGSNAGLLFYHGVEVSGAPGGSFDDHWEFIASVGNPTPHWVLVDNDLPLIDNFGARVTAIPEPSSFALMIIGGVFMARSARRYSRTGA